MKEGWEVKTIGDVCTIIRGKRFVRTDITEDGVPCIHYGDIYTHYGLSVTKTRGCIRPELAKKMRFAEKNDVVVVQAGENNWDIGVGVAYFGEIPAAVHDACFILKHKQNPMFISYYLRSYNYHKYLIDYVHEGKICSFLKPALENAPIPIPPLSEQQSIVDYLDSAFAKIDAIKANAEKALNEAKALFQASLKEMLEPKEGWNYYIFSDLIKLKSGDNLPSKKIVKGSFPVFGGNGIAGYHNQFNKVGINVIIGRVGALCGNVHYVNTPFWLTDNGFEVILAKSIDIDMKFLSIYLRSLNLGKYARQAAQPVISNTSLKDINLFIPPLPEQEVIVERLDSLKSKVDQLQENFDKISKECDALKQAILKQVFE